MSNEKKIKLLNARELIAVTQLHSEIEATVLVRGLKSKFPKHADEERATIKSYQDDLRKMLSLERVSPKGSRSVASLENGIIKIIRRTGKWDGLESTGTFLEPHEALFLIELNRLEVYTGKVIVSLERAYHTFLAHDNVHDSTRLTKMEYLVYSHLMRFGCNLKRFKNEMPSPSSPLSSSPSSSLSLTKCDELSNRDGNSNSAPYMDDNVSDKLYVWNYLFDLLGHRRSIVASENIDRNRYTRIKQSMNVIINKFKVLNPTNSCQCNQIVPDANASVKSSEPPEKKRRKLSNCGTLNVNHRTNLAEATNKNALNGSYFGSGSLNDFMIGNTFRRFKQIFDKIDIIELKTPDYRDDDDDDDDDDGNRHSQLPIAEKFSFDLWTSLDYRRSQPRQPNFRLIVKRPSKSLPSNDDIFKLYRSLICKSAIILVCINEEMSFQAYVYRFTTK